MPEQISPPMDSLEPMPGPSLKDSNNWRPVLLGIFLGGGAAGSVLLSGGILCQCVSQRKEIILATVSIFLWWMGAIFVPEPLRRFHLFVPFLLPIVGPFLITVGVFLRKVFKKNDYLSDDPTLRLILHPPPLAASRKPLELEEVLEHDRQIVSAGDILRWGDVSLKQALIDRLSGGEITPRVIRILRGARNDPDEEVRLFATTILTRLEKGFQERIKTLQQCPDPVNPDGALGRAYFDYAESGLVVDRLSRIFLEMGLTHYAQAIRKMEYLMVSEILRVGAAAAILKKAEVISLCQSRLEAMGKSTVLSELRWIVLYEEGKWEELISDLSIHLASESESAIPPHLAVWRRSNPAGGVG